MMIEFAEHSCRVSNLLSDLIPEIFLNLATEIKELINGPFC